VFDSQIHDVPNWQRAVRSDIPPVEANTIAELAKKLAIDEAALCASVEAYNGACPTDGLFDPLNADNLATTGALQPRKSNWARPIARAPFMAYPIMCGNCFTFGGLKVDPSARVLDVDGRPIAGLYAAGETMGIYYGTYTGATSVLRGGVFGRIAGRHAAASRNETMARP
jgi:tricarballylate dehydrogenase